MLRSRRKWALGYLALLVAVFTLAVPTPAFAYIDPATTSYIIQIASGIIISLSVAFGVFFRRMQIFFVTAGAHLAALRVRLTAKSRQKGHRAGQGDEMGQEIRSSDALSSDAPAKQKGSAPAPLRKTHRQLSLEKMQAEVAKKPRQRQSLRSFLFADDRRFRERLLLAVLAAGGISFTVVLFGCIDLFIGNRTYFAYALQDILGTILLVAGTAFLAMTVVLILFKGHAFDYLISLALGVLVALYLQGNFLNIDFGALIGASIIWENYLLEGVINTVIWLFILLIPFAVHRFKKSWWKSLVIFIPALLIAMQGIGLVTSLASVNAFSGGQETEKAFLSEEGLYEISPDENIIIFVVDSFDQRYVDELFASNPEYYTGRLKGFTQFGNNMSVYDRTFPSIVNMFTGSRYEFEYPGDDFIAQAWRSGEFLPALREHGYTSKLYTDRFYVYNDANDLQGSVDNIATGSLEVNRFDTVKHLTKLSLFRYAPHFTKKRFWITTTVFAEDTRYSDGTYDQYVLDDYAFYSKLKDQGLNPTEEGKNCAIYHINGSHAPYNLNADASKSLVETSAVEQTGASMVIVFEFIDQLKALGLYDNTTIIITGDHGDETDLETAVFYPIDAAHPMEPPVMTALFVKPAGSPDEPLQYNAAPVSHDNLRPFVLAEAGIDSKAWGDGYFDVPKDSRLERVYYRKTYPTETTPGMLQEFAIVGDAHDFSNWREISRHNIAFWY